MTPGGPDGQILGPAMDLQRERHGTRARPRARAAGWCCPSTTGPRTPTWAPRRRACGSTGRPRRFVGPRDGLPLLRLVVDAYGAQHPGATPDTGVQSVAVHLMGLCTILERGAHGRAPAHPRPPARAPAPDARPALAGPAAAQRHADRPRARRGGGARRARRLRRGLGARRVGGLASPTTRPCGAGSIASPRDPEPPGADGSPASGGPGVHKGA